MDINYDGDLSKHALHVFEKTRPCFLKITCVFLKTRPCKNSPVKYTVSYLFSCSCDTPSSLVEG